jgi:hypothetical protein
MISRTVQALPRWPVRVTAPRNSGNAVDLSSEVPGLSLDWVNGYPNSGFILGFVSISKNRDKAAPVRKHHTTKPCSGDGGKATRILNLGAKQRRTVSFKLRQFFPREQGLGIYWTV